MYVKLYSGNDLVKAGCNDCKGCSDCCQGMGESILLDPYDIWQLEIHLPCTFPGLVGQKLDLHVEDGLILPHLKMEGTSQRCVFLTGAGRCGIHDFRPGLCRLFPLGRNYNESSMQYFLLENACSVKERTKIKVKKWVGVHEAAKYEKFLISWHDLRRELCEKIAGEEDDDRIKNINLAFLRIFYERQYAEADFYRQYEERRALFLEGERKGDFGT